MQIPTEAGTIHKDHIQSGRRALQSVGNPHCGGSGSAHVVTAHIPSLPGILTQSGLMHRINTVALGPKNDCLSLDEELDGFLKQL